MEGKYGGVITEQLKRLGCSLDWSRERFTLDEGFSRAVNYVFVSLYQEGLIYRDYYLVNRCPRCQTVLSDIEIEHQEVKGHLWYIKYPLPGTDEAIVVATTRPETMLGDTAVAIHPDDERYKKFHGQKVLLPLQNRLIPVITDEQVQKDFGTGAVKVTPAHDPVDFELGKKHGLEQIIVIDGNGRMTEAAGEEFKGLDRFACREKVIESSNSLAIWLKLRITAMRLDIAIAARRLSSLIFPGNGLSESSRWPEKPSRLLKTGKLFLSRRTGPKPILTGCIKFTIGAFPGSCGGDTASRPITVKTATRLW